MTPAQIEAKARELHETRKANYARNHRWAEPLTFDGGERDFCIESATLALAEEEREAAVQADIDAQLATFTDADLEQRIAALGAEMDSLKHRGFVHELRAEIREERRHLVTEQIRRSVARGADPLATVAAMVCADLLSTAGLDVLSVRMGGDEGHREAAE